MSVVQSSVRTKNSQNFDGIWVTQTGMRDRRLHVLNDLLHRGFLFTVDVDHLAPVRYSDYLGRLLTSSMFRKRRHCRGQEGQEAGDVSEESKSPLTVGSLFAPQLAFM